MLEYLFFDEGNDGGTGTPTPPVPETPNEPTPEPTTKTFTQAQLDDIVKARVDGTTKLKEYGVGTAEELKAIVEAHRKNEDANKTELERMQAQNTTITKELEDSKKSMVNYENSVSALKLGVNPEKVTDFLAIVGTKVNEKTTFAEALKTTLETYPAFKMEGNKNFGQPDHKGDNKYKSVRPDGKPWRLKDKKY